MVESGILRIVAENKIRGTIEKVYAVNEAFFSFGNPVIENNDGVAYFKLFSNFVLELMKEFQAYGERESIHIKEDGSGFSAASIYANMDELNEIGQKINALISPYQKQNTFSKNQKLHTFATIVTPPNQEIEESSDESKE